MAGERVLIVEDEFLIRATLSELLEDEGFQVTGTESGEEALEMVRSDDAIAIMMTDMQLATAMSGLTLAAAVRGLRPDLPIVFMTGRPDRLPSLNSTREAVLTKPYSTNAVAPLIRKLLDG